MSRWKMTIQLAASGMIVAASVVVDAPAASAAVVVHPGGSIQAAVDAARPGATIGIIALATQAQAPVQDWTVQGNRVHDNTKACPASEDGPPASGIGIALAGASHSIVLGNVVTGNRPTGPTLAAGGIAVFSTAVLGGADPLGNLVKANQLRDNDPDLSYDGSGTGNSFLHNTCHTSDPAGLC